MTIINARTRFCVITPLILTSLSRSSFSFNPTASPNSLVIPFTFEEITAPAKLSIIMSFLLVRNLRRSHTYKYIFIIITTPTKLKVYVEIFFLCNNKRRRIQVHSVYKRRPLRPPFLLVASEGIGVTSSVDRKKKVTIELNKTTFGMYTECNHLFFLSSFQLLPRHAMHSVLQGREFLFYINLQTKTSRLLSIPTN